MNNQLLELRTISGSNFCWAKRWFRLFWLSQLVAFGINALTAFNSFPPVWGALVGFGLATAAELLRWRSDTLRTKAEEFKRKEEVMDGFEGYDFAADIADEHAAKSDGTYDLKDEALLKGMEFASTAAKGPRRALENVHESAWFSKHLAKRTAVVAAACLVVALTIAILALVLAIGGVQAQAATAGGGAAQPGSGASALLPRSAAQVVGTVVCGALTFLISVNLFRYCLELFRFAQGAAETVRKSEDLAVAKQSDVATVQALLFEYQMARQSAPMIPTAIWRWNHEWLNRLWPQASKKLRS